MEKIITNLVIKIAFGKVNIPENIKPILNEIVIYAFLMGALFSIICFGLFVYLANNILSLF